MPHIFAGWQTCPDSTELLSVGDPAFPHIAVEDSGISIEGRAVGLPSHPHQKGEDRGGDED
jgi:hypothetical protein